MLQTMLLFVYFFVLINVISARRNHPKLNDQIQRLQQDLNDFITQTNSDIADLNEFAETINNNVDTLSIALTISNTETTNNITNLQDQIDDLSQILTDTSNALQSAINSLQTQIDTLNTNQPAINISSITAPLQWQDANLQSQIDDLSQSLQDDIDAIMDKTVTFQSIVSSYICVKQTMTPNDAELYCNNNYNTNLATIHSATENNAVLNLCDFIASNWIGLKRGSNGIFQWTDGTPLTYENWGTDEPSNDGDCVTMSDYESSAYGKWHVKPCGELPSGVEIVFVCNAPISSTTIREIAQMVEKLTDTVYTHHPEAQSIETVLDLPDLHNNKMNNNNNNNNNNIDDIKTLLITSLALNIVVISILGITLSVYCTSKCAKGTYKTLDNKDYEETEEE